MENKKHLPKHIAIIMDGNRRWAKSKGLPTALGHKEGAKALEKIVKHANKLGIEYITVYAFSTENWNRAKEEVDTLMELFKKYLRAYSKRAETENVRINFLGNKSRFDNEMQNLMTECVNRTKENTGIVFNIAINYGGRDEILTAIKNISTEVKNGILNVDEITEDIVSERLGTKGQVDPDLVIRTSGEMRTSNFLPWQIVYSEFIFIEKNWPNFNEDDLDSAIEVYLKRTRKFGGN